VPTRPERLLLACASACLLLTSAVARAAIPPAIAQTIAVAEDQRRFKPDLEKLLTHADPAVRARAARAVGRLQDSTTVDALRPLLDDAKAEVRREAVFALGQIGHASARPALEGRLADDFDAPAGAPEVPLGIEVRRAVPTGREVHDVGAAAGPGDRRALRADRTGEDRARHDGRVLACERDLTDGAPRIDRSSGCFGSSGVAAFGAIFANRLGDELAARLPAGAHVPTVANPAVIRSLPAALHAPFVAAFAASLQPVFAVAAGISLVAFLLTWLLRDVPLRTTRATAQAVPAAEIPPDA